jgi:hypothetical protein
MDDEYKVERSYDDVLKLLKVFVVNNDDLEKLEGLLSQFNIFEALGAVRTELRHSDFLAFLLDPNLNHGLGDAFLKRFLQNILGDTENLDIKLSAIDIALWDLNNIVVQREWQNVDILLVNKSNKNEENFVVLIENKIDFGEHSDQLKKYYERVRKAYQNFKIIPIFLTPDRLIPSESIYLSAGYKDIHDILNRILATRAASIGPAVRVLIEHYIQMLRRHIMSESEIAQLCRDIYYKHKQALDLIFEHRPDTQSQISSLVKGFVEKEKELILDYASKSYIFFLPKQLDLPGLRRGEGWTQSKRILMFEFYYYNKTTLKLTLLIGPGAKDVREELFNIALKRPEPLRPTQGMLASRFQNIYQKTFLLPEHIDLGNMDVIQMEFQEKWDQFLITDLPAIINIYKNEPWMNVTVVESD